MALGPTNCKRRDGHVSRNAKLTLAGGHVTISSGSPSSIALGELINVRAEDTFNGEHYSGTRWVILRTKEQEIGFMMTPDHAQAWLDSLGVHGTR
jgi:hypothetical protein